MKHIPQEVKLTFYRTRVQEQDGRGQGDEPDQWHEHCMGIQLLQPLPEPQNAQL